MVSSISTYGAATPVTAGTSRTGLEGQLAKYEKERSACVNCASASTLQGKQKIQELDSTIRTLQSQLQAVSAAGSSDSPNETRSSTSAQLSSIDVYV